MKKITIIFVLLLLFGLSTVYSQVAKPAENEKPKATSELLDPKLSPEQQALVLKAGEDNPSRIDESTMIDPKLSSEELATEEDFGEKNAKPDGEANIDAKLEAEKAQKEKQAAAGQTVEPVPAEDQPAGEQAATMNNYRDLPGNGNQQPQGDIAPDVTNFRDMQGTGQQPPGDTPVK